MILVDLIRGGLSPREEKLFEAAEFFLRLLAAGIIFRTILFLNPDTFILEKLLAQISGSLLSIFSPKVIISKNTILMDSTRFILTRDCLGWKSMAAFIGLGFASKLRNLKLMMAGLFGISILNVARIVTTAYLTPHLGFDVLHTYLWRWGLLTVTLVLWSLWFNIEKNLD